ncbi:tryptophan--tRNA ligase 2-like [Bolinopsis microptera]|uniref:tryptophan--tRNA ligase 2-like n=1 Tax=Bolinopsis microptera TaxID=2820187 RepID=UPI00307AB444
MIACRRVLSTCPTRIVSAIQPTGEPHLGNYLGALKHWIALQDQHQNCIFGVADNHVFTSKTTAKQVRSNTHSQVAVLLSLGLDPDRVILYKHSAVLQHTALAWLLSTSATSGLISRLRALPQYREKSQIHDNLGLLTYPVLMSADILLFHGTHIPVGEDQNIHIEFCNSIAQYFNRAYKSHVFGTVSQLLTTSPRVKSLADPSQKMSKSYGRPSGVVGMLDTDDQIRKKVKKAVTDSFGAITVDLETRPGVYNLLQLLSAVSDADFHDVCKKYESKNVVTLKNDLSDCLVETIGPVRNRALELIKDKEFIEKVLAGGAEKASDIAERNLDEIYRTIGLK